MMKLLWMTIDRHPDSLKALIRVQLESTGWEIIEVSYDSIDSLESVPLEEIDAVLLAPARHFPVKFMNRLSKCRLMQIWSSGFDKFNLNDANSRGIKVANNHGANAVSVAEHAILMMLGVSRRAPEMHQRVIHGQWAGNDHGMSSYSLHGKTLGIIGLGNIGTLVARRAEAFGMAISFADPAVADSPDLAWEKKSLEQLLAEADYISLHLHLEDSTRGMIDAKKLELLVKKPFLINVSRAELVDRDALLMALETGLIRGASFDAHYQEPTDPADELFRQQNVMFSPHVAGSTIDSYSDTLAACIWNIRQAMNGNVIQGLVTPVVH